jgi:hypothetical protein
MAKFDTFECAGAEKSLAAWGFALDGSTSEFKNQSVDVLRLVIPGADIEDAEIFPFEAKVIFRTQRDSADGSANSFSGGTVEFSGKRIGEAIQITGKNGGVAYEFHGPWYDLEHTTYQQPIGSWQTGALTFPYQSELLLFSRIDPVTGEQTFISNGDQIRDVLQFVLDEFDDEEDMPFQIGDIDPDQIMPPLPCKPMNCSDVIIKCLEQAPDCIVAFDYTFTPPKCHVKSIYNLTPRTQAIANGIDHKSLHIVPRPDLRPRAVIVIFKIRRTIDGVNYISQAKQKQGPNGNNSDDDPDRGLRVIVDWIDMQGPITTTVAQSIVCTAVDANAGTQAARRAWWALHDKQFADLRLRMQDSAFAATTFPAPAVVDAETGATVSLTDYPRELVDGSIQPSMGFNVKRVKISVLLTYAVYKNVGASETDHSDTPPIHRYTKKEHHIEITVTNGTTGTYGSTSTTPGEDIPVGIAQSVWTSLNRLQYEGEDVRVQAAIDGGVSMLNTLNLSGGRAEWAAMNAQIQSIRKHYGSGETEVSIGPARHLNANQLMDIFRAWRARLITSGFSLRQSGNIGSGGSSTEIGKNAPKKNTMEGLENPSSQVVTYHAGDDPDAAIKGQSILDPKLISDILGATTPSAGTGFTLEDLKKMQPREVLICSDPPQYIIIHSTPPYTKS